MEEEIKALPPASLDVEKFSILWERSSELSDVLARLPSQLVLKSGLAGRRNKLVEGWDKLESPGLDGEVSESAVAALRKWIHEAEISIAHIIQIDKQEKQMVSGRAFAGTEDVIQFETVDSLADVDFVSDEWSFPWAPKRALKRVKSFDKEKMFKYGALGTLGLIAVVAYMDEE